MIANVVVCKILMCNKLICKTLICTMRVSFKGGTSWVVWGGERREKREERKEKREEGWERRDEKKTRGKREEEGEKRRENIVMWDIAYSAVCLLHTHTQQTHTQQTHTQQTDRLRHTGLCHPSGSAHRATRARSTRPRRHPWRRASSRWPRWSCSCCRNTQTHTHTHTNAHTHTHEHTHTHTRTHTVDGRDDLVLALDVCRKTKDTLKRDVALLAIYSQLWLCIYYRVEMKWNEYLVSTMNKFQLSISMYYQLWISM